MVAVKSDADLQGARAVSNAVQPLRLCAIQKHLTGPLRSDQILQVFYGPAMTGMLCMCILYD